MVEVKSSSGVGSGTHFIHPWSDKGCDSSSGVGSGTHLIQPWQGLWFEYPTSHLMEGHLKFCQSPFKKTVSVISSDPPFKEGFPVFTRIPLKP